MRLASVRIPARLSPTDAIGDLTSDAFEQLPLMALSDAVELFDEHWHLNNA